MYNKNPLVSVLIPLYNAEKYLDECLESVISQTYSNIEVIIVNDGSTDNSLEIAKSYTHKYSWIKVYTQANVGAAAARNKAFSYSIGDYIQYLDADDILDPDKILFQINALKVYDYDSNVVATSKWTRLYNSIKSVVFKSQVVYKNYDDSLLFLKDAWDNFDYMIVPAWLAHRDFYKKIGKWNEEISVLDDSIFFAKVAYNAKKMIYVEESISYWRQDNENSLSKNTTKKGMQSHLQVCHNYVELVKDHLDYPGMRHALAMEYSKCIYRSYPMYMDIVREAEKAIDTLGFGQPLPMPTWKFRLSQKIIGFYPTARLFGTKDVLTKKFRRVMETYYEN